MPIRFDHPEMLWLFLLAGPVVMLGRHSLAPLESASRWVAIALRLSVLAMLVLALAGLHTLTEHNDLTVIAVIDASESVRRFAIPPPKEAGLASDKASHTAENHADSGVSIDDWITGWLSESAQGHKPDDQLGIVSYDGRPTVRSLPTTGLNIERGTAPPTSGTDTTAAIRLAMALFSANSGKRILLISDGNDTTIESRGSDFLAAQEARAAGIPIDVLPIEYRLKDEVMVAGFYAPGEANQGQTIALRVVLRATKPSGGVLYLKHDQHLIDLNGPSEGDSLPIRTDQWVLENSTDTQQTNAHSLGRSRVVGAEYISVSKIDLSLPYAGINRFEIVYEPSGPKNAGGDTVAVNNHAEALTLVYGQRRVLFVHNLKPGHSSHLLNTLRDHGIVLEEVPASSIPSQLAALRNYDALILQDVPADQVSPTQQELIARYVNDLGGGLIMIGGPDGFGAGGWSGSPVDRVLPVDCQIPNLAVLPSGALVLVLDRSGSMGDSVAGSAYTKQQIANEAAVLALGTLYPQDMVGVIAFDNHPQWVLRVGFNSNPHTAAKTVRGITPGGGTNIYPALEQAYDALAQLDTQDAAVKHIVLLTDGQSQSSRYHQLAGKMKRAGITLSTIGIGDDVNSPLLSQLAQLGGGRYHYLSDPNNLPRVFMKEARTVRKNLVKETPFLPRVIQTGSPITSGIQSVPQLRGIVRTYPKHDPRVYLSIVSPEGEPVFAHWRVGLGRSAAFTSDATSRWAPQWLQWPGYADFWLRTVRAIARPLASRDYDLVTSIRNNRLHIRLDAAAETASQPLGDTLHVAGTVLDPQGKIIPVWLDQTGSGLYETTVPATQPGHYIVSLSVKNSIASRDQEGVVEPSVIFGAVTRPAGPELRFLHSNRKRLEEIARITGGRVLDLSRPNPGVLFDRQDIAPSWSIRAQWSQLLIWILGVFLLDVAVRRIAWSPLAVKNRAMRHLEAIRQLLQSRPIGASQTLDTLRARAAQVEQKWTPSQSDRDTPPQGDPVREAAKHPTTTQKTHTHDPIGKPKPTNPGNPSEHSSTTARLLHAKRRASRETEQSGE